MMFLFCLLFSGIFTIADAIPVGHRSYNDYESMNMVVTVFEVNKNDKAMDSSYLNDFQRLISEIKTLILKQEHLSRILNAKKLELFDVFLVHIIQILLSLNDAELKWFITTFSDKIKAYNGDEFNDLNDPNSLAAFIENELGKIESLPPKEIRKKITSLSENIKRKNYTDIKKDFFTFINLLSEPNTTEKFQNILRKIENKNHTNFEVLIKKGVQSIVFENYNELDMDTRIALKSAVDTYLKSFPSKPKSKNKKKQYNSEDVSSEGFTYDSSDQTDPEKNYDASKDYGVPQSFTLIDPEFNSKEIKVKKKHSKRNKKQSKKTTAEEGYTYKQITRIRKSFSKKISREESTDDNNHLKADSDGGSHSTTPQVPTYHTKPQIPCSDEDFCGDFIQPRAMLLGEKSHVVGTTTLPAEVSTKRFKRIFESIKDFKGNLNREAEKQKHELKTYKESEDQIKNNLQNHVAQLENEIKVARKPITLDNKVNSDLKSIYKLNKNVNNESIAIDNAVTTQGNRVTHNNFAENHLDTETKSDDRRNTYFKETTRTNSFYVMKNHVKTQNTQSSLTSVTNVINKNLHKVIYSSSYSDEENILQMNLKKSLNAL